MQEREGKVGGRDEHNFFMVAGASRKERHVAVAKSKNLTSESGPAASGERGPIRGIVRSVERAIQLQAPDGLEPEAAEQRRGTHGVNQKAQIIAFDERSSSAGV